MHHYCKSLYGSDTACSRKRTYDLYLHVLISICTRVLKSLFPQQIHRMRIRLDTLKREQDVMIQEMERSIMKREQIAVRFKVNKSSKQTCLYAISCGMYLLASTYTCKQYVFSVDYSFHD
jgi:hypothetical protein